MTKPSKRRAKMTPEEKREYHRKRYHKRRANMTEEQREEQREARRKRARKKRAAMSEEELEEQRAKRREQVRVRRANRSPEEIEADRKRDREKWFSGEKARALGVYKKIWPHLTLKELEKRYALHLLWRSQMCTTCTPGEPERSCIACLLHSANNKR